MREIDIFTNKDPLITFKEDIEKGKRTVLFLGAGINNTKGQHLMWPDLLDFLMDRAASRLNASDEEREIITRAFKNNDKDRSVENLELKLKASQTFSVEVKASIIKQLLGEFYIPTLKQFVYGWDVRGMLREGCQRYVANPNAADSPFHSLFSIADFILKHDNIKAVVTYNYDNYLSSAINLLMENDIYKQKNSRTIKPLDIYSGWKDAPVTDKEFLIYHIHGMVLPDDKIAPHCSNQVVLSMEEYYDMARDVYSWQSSTQIFFLTHYTCAFIGASLSDMTMQRVLHYANLKQSGENVYYLSAKLPNNPSADAFQKLNNSYFRLIGLKVVYDTEGYGKLYEKLNQIK